MTIAVTFLPDTRTIALDDPMPVSDAAAYADVLIDHPCGSNATCGKCRVQYHTGTPTATDAERRLLKEHELAEGWRLSCQSVVAENATIEVPAMSRSTSAKSFGGTELFESGFEPWVQIRDASLPEPDLDWQWALEDSLGKQLGSIAPKLSLDQLRTLIEVTTAESGKLRVKLDGDDVRWIGSQSMQFRTPMGVAVDIGSTSLAAALVNLETGSVVADAATLNPQVRFGADVISRIEFAMRADDGNEQLRRVLVDALNGLFSRLKEEAKIDLLQIHSVCVAGNPAMLHTLLGVDVRQLGIAPYVGAWTRGLHLNREDIGFHLPNARVHIMPMIRSNVGADTVAAIIAAGIDESDEMTVMIDLGTNCEVVIGNRERLLVTSTAAGPAFEGANMQHGMRAAPGAIDRVSLRAQGRMGIRVLGGVKARGICGSGLIDAAAALLRTGVIDATGRMHGREALDEKRYPELASRIVRGEHGHPAVVLARPDESERGIPVMLSALDVRQLQLIKGSIHAGISLLLQHWGLGYEHIDRVLIAGAFGSYLRKSSVLDIGLVPQINPEKVHFIGNAAGVGARMALVDRRAWRRAENIREHADYLELGGHPEYQDVFGASMGFFDSPALLEARR